MATPLHMKRMARERVTLEKPNDDYFVRFSDDNLLKFDAYVFGPPDTFYAHKYVKLRFEIPQRYPLVPPKVTFIQHSGGRIHPNLYNQGGKVCLSILGTWAGEPWAYAMTIETVLITIRSLLDNEPYKHEPNQRDNPNFNQYVQYTTWRSLLIDYVTNERDEAAKAFLEKHISQHGADIITTLRTQMLTNPQGRHLTSPYDHKPFVPNYETLLEDVQKVVEECQAAEVLRTPATTVDEGVKEPITAYKTEPQELTAATAPTIQDARIASLSVSNVGGEVLQTTVVAASIEPGYALPVSHDYSNGTTSVSLKRKADVLDLT